VRFDESLGGSGGEARQQDSSGKCRLGARLSIIYYSRAKVMLASNEKKQNKTILKARKGKIEKIIVIIVIAIIMIKTKRGEKRERKLRGIH
jgi:hypothetical protein